MGHCLLPAQSFGTEVRCPSVDSQALVHICFSVSFGRPCRQWRGVLGIPHLLQPIWSLNHWLSSAFHRLLVLHIYLQSRRQEEPICLKQSVFSHDLRVPGCWHLSCFSAIPFAIILAISFFLLTRYIGNLPKPGFSCSNTSFLGQWDLSASTLQKKENLVALHSGLVSPYSLYVCLIFETLMTSEEKAIDIQVGLDLTCFDHSLCIRVNVISIALDAIPRGLVCQIWKRSLFWRTSIRCNGACNSLWEKSPSDFKQ